MSQPSRPAPGGGPTAHVDTFARDALPPDALLPMFNYAWPPELAAYPDRFNVAEVLLDGVIAAGHGDRPAVHLGDASWSYRDLQTHADRIARVVTEDMGLVPGNRVLLRGPNTPMLLACWYGVVKAGGICVTTMPLLRARELEDIIDKARVTHALCDLAFADELEDACAARPELAELRHYTALGGGAAEATLDGAAAGKRDGFTAVDTTADDVVIIGFTSGTTGASKAAAHFHRDLLAICDCYPRHIAPIVADDVIAGTPPVAFTFGLGAFALFPMRFGASTRFLPSLAPEGMLEAIERYRVTQLYTAPTAYRRMAELAADFDLTSLRFCNSAGETLPAATFEAFLEATGIKVIDGIGSTEMLQTFLSAPPDAVRPGFTGKAVPGYETRVLDDDGNEKPPGEPGFLAVRGPTGCKYLDDPERQKGYVRHGWNYTGDLYETDAEGYFRYVSRADDLIISSGYNIAGPEVEAALLRHATVAECAVIGVPDPERTSIVKAFVVLRDGAPGDDATARTLQDFVKAEIAPYKYPRAIEFVDALPKTQTGKLQRFRLRQRGVDG